MHSSLSLKSCLLALLALFPAAVGCSGNASAPSPTTGGSRTGGIASQGGTLATGGSSGGSLPGTGGISTGGITGTGGSLRTGGAGAGGGVATGGVPKTGGLTTSGGVSPATGGVATGGLSTGGTATGGVRTGGIAQTGGTTRDAGAPQDAQPLTGGMPKDGGQAGGPDTATGTGGGEAKPSAGCGQSTFQPSGKYTITVNGTQRSYIIKLPAGYDNTKPFRLIMTWHGLGGTAERTANAGYEGSYYGLEPLAGSQAIFTSGQGLSESMGTGWANTNDQDVKFVRALVESLQKSYCIDNSRIFSVGKSYGGFFSNVLGCEMGDVFRAIAPQSSWLPSPVGTCVGQPAAFIDHGTTDTTIELSRGTAARDLWIKTNHCGSTTKPWNNPETTCVSYDGCDVNKPVVWCEFSGGHVMPTWAASAVWKFLQQF